MTKDNTVRVKGDVRTHVLCEPRPCADILFIRMAKHPDTSEGGIDMATSSRPPLPYGKLLGKGPDCSTQFTVGMHLIVPPYAGSLIELGDGEFAHRFVRERDIVGYFAATEPAKE